MAPPLALRNSIASKFNNQRVHDMVYDAHSGLTLLACGSTVFSLDHNNRLERIAGDAADGALLADGPVPEARFIAAQRLASDGCGTTFVRDRDTASKNGFCLRALLEAPPAPGGYMEAVPGFCQSDMEARPGHPPRAVETIQTGDYLGPHCFAFDPARRALLFATRGRAVHRLLPHGITRTLAGSDMPLTLDQQAAALAAASSATSSDESDAERESDDDDDDFTDACVLVDELGRVYPSCTFTNIQALAADTVGRTGNVYVLDGINGSVTSLRVLQPNGEVELLSKKLRVGPRGSSRWPRLAVLPYDHLAVYGTSHHDMTIVDLKARGPSW
ncbi:hypothetical protein HYH03_013681 [Edaphochlamys debaryana]|uniref:Uncharacterized protein n=1 Tax=Edaphochlamys debaryana TaxID=47281 RepID=A0A835XPI9_9CHLO|nr:hypothetical protein HYH03_013681 [Edaphochlamys debaryana]|eukprot:KAG2487681.1 hypothetical protein HYH03_013681 [Edaphochlamys debaryana]